MRSLSPLTSAKLFATGFTIGPVVDSLHNQCLLHYNLLPISIPWPSTPAFWTEQQQQQSFWDVASSGMDPSFLFCSSWTVPPLLGFAYVVLGGILPRVLESLLHAIQNDATTKNNNMINNKIPELQQPFSGKSTISTTNTNTIIETYDPSLAATTNESIRLSLRQKAWLAVTTTALIIKLSEFLETQYATTTDAFSEGGEGPWTPLIIMLVAALSQWAWLDQSLVGLLAASITMVGGPLSELPFVAAQVWEYLPTASDYFPLAHLPSWLDAVAVKSLGDGYEALALSSITGPCYFAVTMDAIALGRWFDSQDVSDFAPSND